jgi:hypothetical protein
MFASDDATVARRSTATKDTPSLLRVYYGSPAFSSQVSAISA